MVHVKLGEVRLSQTPVVVSHTACSTACSMAHTKRAEVMQDYRCCNGLPEEAEIYNPNKGVCFSLMRRDSRVRNRIIPDVCNGNRYIKPPSHGTQSDYVW